MSASGGSGPILLAVTTACTLCQHWPSGLKVQEENLLLRAGRYFTSKLTETAQGARHILPVWLDCDLSWATFWI